jgi:hypothetical protein
VKISKAKAFIQYKAPKILENFDNCLFQCNSYIINNLRKNKVFLFCAKKQGISAWRQNNRAKLPLGNWLVKFTEKKVDRLAQLLNFTESALYAVRRAVNFGEIDPRGRYHQLFESSFYVCRSLKRKKILLT